MSQLIKYLQSYQDYFWQYEDAGKVIAIPNGNTIGYSEVVLSEIVKYLAPQGLPRFGALLLAIVATNPRGAESIDAIFSIVASKVDVDKEIRDAITFAKLLAQLPDRYKKGKLRIELFRGIFYSSHNSIGALKSKKIGAALDGDFVISKYDKVLSKSPLPNGHIATDFRVLGLIGRQLNSIEAILVRLAYLPTYEDDLDLQIEKEPGADSLIDQLMQDEKTFYAGALVSRLIGGLNIPFHSSLPSLQPLGGVADITNKGSFDKLLVSEFSFDDDVLMSRLANNESLYHHREVPPADNNYHRIILIDTTLKNWGNIRTIAFATMLAITNHPQNNNPCRVFLVGKSYVEVEFETASDIISAMQILDSSLDPGAGLLELFTTEKIEVSEVFFVGNIESLDQPRMQLFSAEYGKRIDHWIHPKEGGHISVFKNLRRGKRFVQELNLSLGKIWKKEREFPRRREETDIDTTYPILFPANKTKSVWFDNHFIYKVSKERALLRRYGVKDQSEDFGWEMIDSNFAPSYQLLAVMTHEDFSTTVLVAESKDKFFLLWPKTKERIEVKDTTKIMGGWKFDVAGKQFVSAAGSNSYYINLDGSVADEAHTHKVESTNERSYGTKQVYKNIDGIGITLGGRLRFGKQELISRYHRLVLQCDNQHQDRNKVQAKMSIKGIFEFPDGSTIEHNRNGMLTLKSANNAIPEIYLPCVLNIALGVATNDTFAGDSYYRKEQRSELYFEEIKARKLEAVKLIKHTLNIGLGAAKNNIAERVVSSMDHDKVLSLQRELSNIGITTTYGRRGIEQELINTEDFYQKYIQAFIDQILSYEH